MEAGKRAIALIKRFEGLRLTAYPDTGGWAIGYGTTRGIQQGMQINADQAESYLQEDLKAIALVVKGLVKVGLNQGQFDSLLSFVYNVGETAFAKSTLLRLLNQRNYQGAAAEFGRWNKADGFVLPGLSDRRAAEKELFLEDTAVTKTFCAYALEITQDTRLLVPGAIDGKGYSVASGQQFPISSYGEVGEYYKFSLGKIDGQQQAILNRNTWLVHQSYAQILRDGKSVQKAIATTPIKGSLVWVLAKGLGIYDGNGCYQMEVSLMVGDKAVDRVPCISGAIGTAPVHPIDDYSGSMRPCPEGVFDVPLGVERGDWGDAIGSIYLELHPRKEYDVNDRRNIALHEDANRAYSPGSAGCICPLSYNGISRIAKWFEMVARPEYVVVDHGMSFLAKKGWRMP